MTEIKKPTDLEGIYAFRDPKAEIQKRMGEDSALLSFQENNPLAAYSLQDTDILAGLNEVQSQIGVTDIDAMINEYSTYDETISENKNIISTQYSQNYSYDNSQLASLETTKSNLESDITKNQSDLASILNGSHPQIAQAQSEVNSAQEAYSKAIDESQNPQIIALKEQIEENTLNIGEQESIIAFCETQIADTKTQISQQESTIASLESEISSYDSQISSLQSALSSCENSAQKSKLQSRISNLQSLKGNAQARKTNEQTILDTLKNKLSALEEQKPKEEATLEQLKTTRQELENQVVQVKDEAINSALSALQTARENLDSTKESLISQISGAITSTNSELQSVENQIAQLKEELFKQEQEEQNQQSIEQQSDTIQSSVYPTTSSGRSKSPASNAISSSKAGNEVSQQQLEENLNTTKKDLETKIKNLLSALNWESQGAVFEARSTKDAEFDKFYSELSKTNPSLANQIKEAKTNMDSKEQALDKIEAQLLPYENQINELQGQIDAVDIQISALLEAQSQLEGVDESELDSEQKADLKEKRASIQEKIKELNEQKDELNEQIKAIKESDEYKQLSNEKQIAQSEYNNAKREYDTAMSKAESSSAKESYQKSFDNYNNTKQNALGEVQSAQTQVSELSKTVETSKASSLAKEYKFSSNDAQEILDFAQSFIGCNEADGSANKFLNGGSSASTPWCAAFVQYVLQNSGGYEDTADWYKNIDNKWYCPNIANAAQSAGAVVDQAEAQPGDIVLFYNDSKGRYAHVGIVKSIDADGTVHTIEGNTSNQVAERTYAKGQRKMTFCKTAA